MCALPSIKYQVASARVPHMVPLHAIVPTVVVACLTLPPLAEASDTTAKRIGNWIANEADCTISASFRNGRSLIIGSDGQGNLSLALRSIHWNLPDNYSNTLLYWADSDDPQRASAREINTQTLSIRVNDPSWITMALKYTRGISFAFGEKSYRFPITHGDRAAAWITDCTGIALRPPIRGNGNRLAVLADDPQTAESPSFWLQPFVVPSDTTRYEFRPISSRAADRGQDVAEGHGAAATTMVISMLTRAGIEDFDVDVPQDKNAWAVPVDAVWRSVDRHGAVRLYDTMTPDRVYSERRKIVAHDKLECLGAFQATRLPFANDQVTGFMTVCQEKTGQDAATRTYIVAAARTGEHFAFMTAYEGDPTDNIWPETASLAMAAGAVAREWKGT